MLRRLALLLFLGVLVAGTALAGDAEDRFPPPDLGPDYVQPKATEPAVTAEAMVYIDIAALVIALSLASWIALKVRSRRAMFLLACVSLGYFGFFREGCVCPIGAIQNVTMGIFVEGYTAPVVVVLYFFLPLLTTAFFGRSFCAAVCPLGAIQDIVLVKPYRLPPALSKALGVVPYMYLGAGVLFAATGAAYIICQYDPFIAIFRLTGEANMLVLGGAFLVLGMFIGRPYCRFLCPYGVLLSWMSTLSRWRITITPTDCVVCRLCEEKACPFEAISMPTQPSKAFDRYRGKLRLATLLLVAPLLIGGGWWVGGESADTFARMHYKVRQLDRVNAEAAGTVEGTTDLSESFHGSGRPLPELEAEVASIRSRFDWGTPILFAFIGLVIAIKLIKLTVRRRQQYYEADRDACYACARCYEYCPVEQEERRGSSTPPGMPEFVHVCSGS